MPLLNTSLRLSLAAQRHVCIVLITQTGVFRFNYLHFLLVYNLFKLRDDDDKETCPFPFNAALRKALRRG